MATKQPTTEDYGIVIGFLIILYILATYLTILELFKKSSPKQCKVQKSQTRLDLVVFQVILLKVP